MRTGRDDRKRLRRPEVEEEALVADRAPEGVHRSLPAPRSRGPLLLLPLLAWLLALPGGAWAQDHTSDLTGTAVAAGSEAPIAGLEVRLLGTDLRATTEADGRFRIERLEPGTYWMEVNHLGSTSGAVRLRLPAASVLDLKLDIVERLVPVEELKVDVGKRTQRGKLAGFYERRARGFGWFLTREDLDRAPGHFLSTVFRQVPGLRVVPFGTRETGGGYRIFNQRSNCEPVFYLDGARLSDGSRSVGGERFLKTDMAAIEIYRGPSEVPPVYRDSRSTCGVILLWTRTATEAD